MVEIHSQWFKALRVSLGSVVVGVLVAIVAWSVAVGVRKDLDNPDAISLFVSESLGRYLLLKEYNASVGGPPPTGTCVLGADGTCVVSYSPLAGPSTVTAAIAMPGFTGEIANVWDIASDCFKIDQIGGSCAYNPASDVGTMVAPNVFIVNVSGKDEVAYRDRFQTAYACLTTEFISFRYDDSSDWIVSGHDEILLKSPSLEGVAAHSGIRSDVCQYFWNTAHAVPVSSEGWFYQYAEISDKTIGIMCATSLEKTDFFWYTLNTTDVSALSMFVDCNQFHPCGGTLVENGTNTGSDTFAPDSTVGVRDPDIVTPVYYQANITIDTADLLTAPNPSATVTGWSALYNSADAVDVRLTWETVDPLFNTLSGEVRLRLLRIFGIDVCNPPEAGRFLSNDHSDTASMTFSMKDDIANSLNATLLWSSGSTLTMLMESVNMYFGDVWTTVGVSVHPCRSGSTGGCLPCKYTELVFGHAGECVWPPPPSTPTVCNETRIQDVTRTGDGAEVHITANNSIVVPSPPHHTVPTLGMDLTLTGVVRTIVLTLDNNTCVGNSTPTTRTVWGFRVHMPVHFTTRPTNFMGVGTLKSVTQTIVGFDGFEVELPAINILDDRADFYVNVTGATDPDLYSIETIATEGFEISFTTAITCTPSEDFPCSVEYGYSPVQSGQTISIIFIDDAPSSAEVVLNPFFTTSEVSPTGIGHLANPLILQVVLDDATVLAIGKNITELNYAQLYLLYIDKVGYRNIDCPQREWEPDTSDGRCKTVHMQTTLINSDMNSPWLTLNNNEGDMAVWVDATYTITLAHQELCNWSGYAHINEIVRVRAYWGVSPTAIAADEGLDVDITKATACAQAVDPGDDVAEWTLSRVGSRSITAAQIKNGFGAPLLFVFTYRADIANLISVAVEFVGINLRNSTGFLPPRPSARRRRDSHFTEAAPCPDDAQLQVELPHTIVSRVTNDPAYAVTADESWAAGTMLVTTVVNSTVETLFQNHTANNITFNLIVQIECETTRVRGACTASPIKVNNVSTSFRFGYFGGKGAFIAPLNVWSNTTRMTIDINVTSVGVNPPVVTIWLKPCTTLCPCGYSIPISSDSVHFHESWHTTGYVDASVVGFNAVSTSDVSVPAWSSSETLWLNTSIVVPFTQGNIAAGGPVGIELWDVTYTETAGIYVHAHRLQHPWPQNKLRGAFTHSELHYWYVRIYTNGTGDDAVDAAGYTEAKTQFTYSTDSTVAYCAVPTPGVASVPITLQFPPWLILKLRTLFETHGTAMNVSVDLALSVRAGSRGGFTTDDIQLVYRVLSLETRGLVPAPAAMKTSSSCIP